MYAEAGCGDVLTCTVVDMGSGAGCEKRERRCEILFLECELDPAHWKS